MSKPVEFYYWPTPNGWKVGILLEELGIAYQVIPINIGAGDQFQTSFLAISPNNKVPAIIDPQGPGGQRIALFESGAILWYLAEKHGRFLPHDARDRYAVMQWLMFQMAGIGPMLGQAHHFRHYAPQQIQYAIERYTQEAGRLYAVLERRLHEVEYLAGELSIADFAVFPWLSLHQRQGQDLAAFPKLQLWYAKLAARTAVQTALALLSEQRTTHFDTTARETLFGATQYARR